MQRFVFAFIALAAFLPPSSFASQAEVDQSIGVDETREGEISGCQIDAKTQKKVCAIHNYKVDLSADKYWHVEVEQLGIDLVLSMLASDGQPAIEVITPIERSGVSTAAGSYALQVSSREHPKASGL